MTTQNENFYQGDLRAYRKARKLSQADFWSAVKVTQSGGSRYESGREAPDQVLELVRLLYEFGIDTSRITADNATAVRDVIENGLLDPAIAQRRAELNSLEDRIRAASAALNPGAIPA